MIFCHRTGALAHSPAERGRLRYTHLRASAHSTCHFGRRKTDIYKTSCALPEAFVV